MKRALIVTLIACSRPPRDLPYDLDGVRSDRDVARMQVPDLLWDRTIVEPYKRLYPQYVKEFDAGRPELERQIYRDGEIAARQHYADDPQLTAGQARARWTLRVLEASQVATIGGQVVDAVFVRDGDRWFAITGIDRIVRREVDAYDPACGALIDGSATKRCREVAWEVVDAALRTQDERVRHACALAKTACGKPAP